MGKMDGLTLINKRIMEVCYWYNSDDKFINWL